MTTGDDTERAREIVIRLEVPEDAMPQFAYMVHAVVDTIAPLVQLCGGSGQILLDGQPIDGLQ